MPRLANGKNKTHTVLKHKAATTTTTTTHGSTSSSGAVKRKKVVPATRENDEEEKQLKSITSAARRGANYTGKTTNRTKNHASKPSLKRKSTGEDGKKSAPAVVVVVDSTDREDSSDEDEQQPSSRKKSVQKKRPLVKKPRTTPRNSKSPSRKKQRIEEDDANLADAEEEPEEEEEEEEQQPVKKKPASHKKKVILAPPPMKIPHKKGAAAAAKAAAAALAAAAAQAASSPSSKSHRKKTSSSPAVVTSSSSLRKKRPAPVQESSNEEGEGEEEEDQDEPDTSAESSAADSSEDDADAEDDPTTTTSSEEEDEQEEEQQSSIPPKRRQQQQSRQRTNTIPTRSSSLPAPPPTTPSAAATPPEPPKRRRKLAAHETLQIGSEVMCKWSGNNEEYPAKVLKRRDGTKTGEYQVYVRYQGFDHRLDEWVPKNRVTAVLVPSTTSSSRQPVTPALLPRALSRVSNASSEDEGQVKNIHTIELGRFEIDTWYFSPYPEEYCKESKLYLCEFCLKYVKKKHTLERHAQKCECRSPPGTEIYREGDLSVFEVDGKKHRTYCQNLCLLSKLFLDHKTLYYDVDPFLFYILCECDSQGAHIVGYFSKEKYSPDNYNLACILTLPPYQRKGYGSFLISFSYELSRRAGMTGTPEKPLSDLGRLGYHSYWSRVILELINSHKGESLSIKDISKLTGITVEDITETLRALKLVRFWRGQHVLIVSQNLVSAFLNSQTSKKFRVMKPKLLQWTPKKT